ncbi:MAG: AAA family ATPase [Gemmatimonadota bacterium]|nr:AAA family ATPase [Gemmatimonadota bacterium]
MTQVIFLFGRPGVGKLTVGELLSSETGYRLLHNHSVVDLVTSLFPFGSPPFVALRERIWLQAIDATLWAKSAGVIMTFAPESTVTDEFIPTLQKRITDRGGVLRFIELRCSDDELEIRIKADSRERFGKLRDIYQFRKLDKAGAFERPKMPEAELVVDTTQTKPLEAARVIAKHLHQSPARRPDSDAS